MAWDRSRTTNWTTRPATSWLEVFLPNGTTSHRASGAFTLKTRSVALDMDGKRYVATGLSEIRKLFDEVAAPETGTIEDDDGDCRSLFVQSIVTVRCPTGQLLIVATTEWFTQTFIVEYTTPDPAVAGVASVAVVTSVMTVKRVGVYPQTPRPSRQKR
ncbi:unnamed protein product [Aphis gossypii]|uniref:Uncharacterized protein n=1 Tax=Aphis gossypii TaxID=80765 RepID=A0A9P0NDD8_APHGO|nr:unnamed protein product [Aphis gossypii]